NRNRSRSESPLRPRRMGIPTLCTGLRMTISSASPNRMSLWDGSRSSPAVISSASLTIMDAPIRGNSRLQQRREPRPDVSQFSFRIDGVGFGILPIVNRKARVVQLLDLGTSDLDRKQNVLS